MSDFIASRKLLTPRYNRRQCRIDFFFVRSIGPLGILPELSGWIQQVESMSNTAHCMRSLRRCASNWLDPFTQRCGIAVIHTCEDLPGLEKLVLLSLVLVLARILRFLSSVHRGTLGWKGTLILQRACELNESSTQKFAICLKIRNLNPTHYDSASTQCSEYETLNAQTGATSPL